LQAIRPASHESVVCDSLPDFHDFVAVIGEDSGLQVILTREAV
jgi:hypothetical protein